MLASKLTNLARKPSSKRARGVHTSSLIREFPVQKVTEVNNNLADYFTGEVNVSKLSNGVTVISKDGNGIDTSFGVYVNAGRNRENGVNSGVTSFFPKLSLKSTHNTSGLRVTRYIESITGDFDVKAGRETVEYHANFLKPNAENVATALAEILRPRLAEWEFRDSKSEIESELKNNPKNLSERITDAIYFQAYKGQGVGRKATNNLVNVSPSTIREFVAEYFVGNLVTVVGVGINHSSLADVSEAFSYLPAEGKPQERSNYFGGDYVEEDASVGSSLSIAYPISSENVVAFRVLSNLLGAGKVSKNRTAIGDGVNSRLASFVASSANVDSVSSFVLDGSNGGGSHPFFVVSGLGNTDATSELTKGLFAELSRLDNINEEEVKRAVKLAKLQFNSLLEQRDTLKNLLYFGNGKNPVTSLSSFDSITANSLKTAISNTFSVKPTVVCIGNLNGFSH